MGAASEKPKRNGTIGRPIILLSCPRANTRIDVWPL